MEGSPTTSTAAAIARDLQDAGSSRAQRLADLYAETVELRHVPPIPSDGPIPGSALAEVSLRETAAVAKALPDRSETAEIKVEGDTAKASIQLGKRKETLNLVKAEGRWTILDF